MKYNDLWSIPSSDDPIQSTDNVKEIFKQQCQYLKTATNGNVFGKFRPIKQADMFIVAESLSRTFAKFEEQVDEETDNLKNANELYSDQRYCFEIYNKAYKFRLFEMILSPVYPIKIIIDEGIWEDSYEELIRTSQVMAHQNTVFVASDDMLLNVLGVIFASKKVRFIIQKLQEIAIQGNEN